MITKIYNSILARQIAFVLVISMLSLSFRSAEEKVLLRAGTQVGLETTKVLASNMLTIGSTVDFRVTRDIKVEDKVVVSAGALAKGQVVRVEPARGLGQAGYVEVQIKSVESVDGQQVPLTGGNLYAEGKDQQTLAIVLGILVCILFLTIKGKNAVLPAGSSVEGIVATDMNVIVAE